MGMTRRSIGSGRSGCGGVHVEGYGRLIARSIPSSVEDCAVFPERGNTVWFGASWYADAGGVYDTVSRETSIRRRPVSILIIGSMSDVGRRRPRLDAQGSGTRGRGSLYCLGMLMMSTITVCLGDIGRCDYRAGMERVMCAWMMLLNKQGILKERVEATYSRMMFHVKPDVSARVISIHVAGHYGNRITMIDMYSRRAPRIGLPMVQADCRLSVP